MEGILKFNLPEEKPEFNFALRGVDYYCAILEFERLLEEHVKWDHNPQWDTKTIEEIRSKFWEIVMDHVPDFEQ